MKISKLVLTTLIASTLASSAFAAPSYRYITKSNKKRELEMRYPQLTSTKKAALAINKAIKKTTNEWIDFKEDRSVSFKSKVDSINSRYFAFSADAYSELGAHPESFTESHVYNLKTGKEVDIEKSLGLSLSGEPSDEDMKRYDEAHRAIAEIMTKHIPADSEGCYGESHEADLEMIAGMDVGATIRKGQLVLILNPAHVVAACGFEAAVTIKEVDAILTKDSILRTWLK